MKTITTQEILELAKEDPKSRQLYKMSYLDILAVRYKIESTIHEKVDGKKFASILARLKSHVITCEEQIRYNEARRVEKLASLEEIASYIEKCSMIKREVR